MDQTEAETNANYYDARRVSLQKLEEKGLNIHPHKFSVTCAFSDFKSKYSHLTNGEQVDADTVQLAGRITTKRSSSSKLAFYDFFSDGDTLQIIANYKAYKEPELFAEINDVVLKRGDIVGVIGTPARSRSGELSVIAHKLVLLSPCYHNLPLPNTLTDLETRHRNRHLDLIVNSERLNIFKMRAKIISFVRRFFDTRGFVEVETPMMSTSFGGANAAPFVTYHNATHSNMFLRIAPELYLKQLIVGGFDRVYELGKNARNEGQDLSHNPEYSAIECYQAYADYEDMIVMTEELLSTIVKELFGSYVIPYTLKNGEKCTIDFTPPFRRFPMIETLEERLKVKFPIDLTTEECNVFLRDLLKKLDLTCDEPLTTPRLLDKLVSEYIEPDLVNPGFITDHPQIMSPLAKWHRSKPGMTERFEMFVAGRELVNSYTELNDAFKQRECFLSEQKGRENGDSESQPIDEGFCICLEHALPPTGGWGMGIDRLVMLLTGQTSIREVILFPALKPTPEEKRTQRQMKSVLKETIKSMAEAADAL